MSGPLYGIYGAGGCGRGVMPVARDQLAREAVDASRLVFIDDHRRGERLNGHDVYGYDEFMNQAAAERHVVLAIADGATRRVLTERCAADGMRPWSVRASTVVTMDDVQIGPGAVLSPFVTITSNIVIGSHFHANLYSYVEHDCEIGDFVTFAPGAKCNGNVRIGDGAYIGSGAVIRQGRAGAPLVIGRGAIVGMGAVVTKSVDPGETVVGNPARPYHTSNRKLRQ